MAVSPSFLDFVREAFSVFGEISIRKMFGGAGAYCDGLFFAVIDGETIYLKTDEVTRSAFESAGLEAFSFETKDGALALTSYFAAPEGMFDEEDELRRWTTLALDAARRKAKLKKKKAAKKG